MRFWNKRAARARKLALAGLVFASYLTGCSPSEPDQPSAELPFSPVIAEVNGEPIRERDIERELARLPENLRAFRNEPTIKQHLLRRMIHQRLLAQQARTLGLDLDPEFRERLARIERRLLAEAATEWRKSQIGEPGEDEIRAYYEAHPQDFTVPEQIHARHILVASEAKARKLIRRLKRHPEEFEALAAKESLDDSNRARGGDLNWFSRGVMVPAFEQAAFKLKEGEIGGPVRTRFGWHIIQVVGRKPASRRPLAEVRDEIASILTQQRLEQWIAELEERARIRILDDSYRPSPAPAPTSKKPDSGSS